MFDANSPPPVVLSKQARASPTRLSHDIYFRNEGSPLTQMYAGGLGRSGLGPGGGGGLKATLPASQYQSQDRNDLWLHPSQIDLTSSSSEADVRPNVQAPLPFTQASSSSATPPRGAVDTKQPKFASEQDERVPVTASHNEGGGNTAALLSELKVENRNLRMRLMYMDEVFAKRNIQHTVVNDLVDCKQELEMTKRELAQAQQQYDALHHQHTLLMAQRDELVERQESLMAERKELEVIPQLRQALRAVELDRDDAVTKLLTLQLEISTERQQTESRIRCLEEERDECKTMTTRALESKDEAISNERLSSEVRLQQLTANFEMVKSDLRAMVEQRTEALNQTDRELTDLRSTAESLKAELAAAHRKLSERDDCIDELQRENHDIILHRRRADVETQDAVSIRDKRVAVLEVQVAEQTQLLGAADDMTLVYKRALQYSVDRMKNIASAATPTDAVVDADNCSGGNAFDEVSLLSSPPHRLPIEPSRQPVEPVTSAAAVMMAGVLKASVDDAAAHVQHMLSLRKQEQEDGIRYSISQLLSAADQCFVVRPMAKLRQLNHRLADLSDLSELCLRRRRKQASCERADWVKAKEDKEALLKDLRTAEGSVVTLSEENAQLIEELRHLTSERDAERNILSTLVTTIPQLSDDVRRTIAEGLRDVRSGIVMPSNPATPEFLDGLRQTVRKSHAVVEGIHDLIHVAQKQYHMAWLSGHSPSPSAGASVSPLRSMSASAITPTSSRSLNNASVEHLVNQLANVCVLLESSVSQSQQSCQKLSSILTEWEQKNTRSWASFEGRITAVLEQFYNNIHHRLRQQAAAVPPPRNTTFVLHHQSQKPSSSLMLSGTSDAQKNNSSGLFADRVSAPNNEDNNNNNNNNNNNLTSVSVGAYLNSRAY